MLLVDLLAERAMGGRLFYRLPGADTLADDERASCARAGFVTTMARDLPVQGLGARWAAQTAIPDVVIEACGALDALAAQAGCAGRRALFGRSSEEVGSHAAEKALTIVLAAMEYTADAALAADAAWRAEALAFVERGGVHWRWLVDDLLQGVQPQAFANLVNDSVTFNPVKGWAEPKAPRVRYETGPPEGLGAARRRVAEIDALLAAAEAGGKPVGRKPSAAEQASLRRGGGWYYRRRVRGEAVIKLAEDFATAAQRRERREQAQLRRKDVRDAIDRAAVYLRLDGPPAGS